MPSDLKRAVSDAASGDAPLAPVVGPPSVKLLVRLFLIPLFIVGIAVGIMFLIGRMAGGAESVDEAVKRLKNPGGGRTADWLIGPGAKQRYMDAKLLTDQMKAGMNEEERIKLADDLTDILDNHSDANEGEVQHFLLLALGRVWQKDPRQPEFNSPAAIASRQKSLAELMKYVDDPHVADRKAAILALVYWAGRDEVKQALPRIEEKVKDGAEDLDVRLAAATALGPLATPEDAAAIAALHAGLNDTKAEDAELVWSSALSLAELNQPDVADTILMLLDRKALSQLQYFDRETDPNNPTFRGLSEQEQERILINTMIGSQHYSAKAVQDRLKWISENDPSSRVRIAAKELLAGGKGDIGG